MGISEMRWVNNGKVIHGNHVLANSEREVHTNGVGIAMTNEIGDS